MIGPISTKGIGWACAVVLAAGACSRDSDKREGTTAAGEPVSTSTSSAKTDNACQLLTKAEAKGALRSDIEKVSDEGKPFPMGTTLRSSCFYRGDGGSVTLTVNSYESAEASAQRFNALKRMYRGARQVAGLGDEAFAENEALVIKDGSRHLTIDLQPEGADKITDYSDMKQMEALLARERQIAVTALGRLPEGTSTPVATSAEPGTSARSACALVTKSDMESILGGPLSYAVAKDSPASTVCTYTGAGGRYAQLTIEWQGGESGIAGARLAGKLMGATAGDVKVTTPVEGVGDEAIMMIGGVLNVRKGPALIAVDLRMQDNSEAKAKAIAQRVIAKL
ncbi:MAG: hypothetical protein ABI681_07820 [Gemmatimonadales bacterium]